MITKPMLAAEIEDRSQIKLPCFVSPKLDGIRALIVDGVPLTRKFKPIPNRHITECLQLVRTGLDGELIFPGKTFNNIQSGIMSREGTPVFEYWVFDDFEQPDEPYSRRYRMVEVAVQSAPTWALLVPQAYVASHVDLELTEQNIIARFLNEPVFEGFCYRSPSGVYKSGRSTLNQFYLAKWKSFRDSEAVVLEFEELQRNTNPQELDALGHHVRRSLKAGKIPGDTLGGVIVRDLQTGMEFSIGSGFNDAIRKEIWANREAYRGKIVRYRYQPVGQKEKPRFPTFTGFRHPDDIGEPDA